MCAGGGSGILTPVDTVSGEVATVALCGACVRRKGLCRGHAKGVLPQLAQPFWYQLVGTHYQKTAAERMSPEARRVYERKRTKRARQSARELQMATARQKSLTILAA